MGYAAHMDDDYGMKVFAGAGAVLCALVMLVIFFSGWRSEEAGTTFVVCLLFLPICAARLRGP